MSEMTGDAEARRPVAKYGAGGVSIAMWKHTHHEGDRSWNTFSCQIQNRYQDGDGNWKSSESFSPSNLEDLLFVIHRALQFMRVRDLLNQAPEDGAPAEPF